MEHRGKVVLLFTINVITNTKSFLGPIGSVVWACSPGLLYYDPNHIYSR